MPGDLAARFGVKPGTYSLRPEKVQVLPAGSAEDGRLGADATVVSAQYQGAIQRIQLRFADGATILAAVPASGASLAPGTTVCAVFDRAALHPMEDAE